MDRLLDRKVSLSRLSLCAENRGFFSSGEANARELYPPSDVVSLLPNGAWLLSLEFRLRKPFTTGSDLPFNPGENDGKGVDAVPRESVV